MTDNREAILDIGECVTDMDYAHLATSLIELKHVRASKEEMAALHGIFLKRAKELGMGQELKGLLRTMQQEVPLPAPGRDSMLALDARGNPLCTIDNLVWILEHDESFLSARYNDLICAAELGEDGYRPCRAASGDRIRALQPAEAPRGAAHLL